MRKVTDKQQQVLDFIKAYIGENDHAPSRREIAEAFGVEANAAQGHIQALATKGFLKLEAFERRGITLIERPE